MIFKRLFRKAPPPAPPTPEALAEAALNGTDAAARRQACRVIDDLSVLRQVAECSSDIGARDLSAARYRRLLCDLESGAAQLPQALTEIAEFYSLEQLGPVALGARAPELRRAAIERLPVDAPILARCAVEDALPGLRQRAVERIASREQLEQVIKHIGKRDTKVYRLAREKLRVLAQQEERPQLVHQRCAELCAQLERLGRFNHWIQDRARLKLLDQQWAEIQADLESEDRDTYQRLRAAFMASFEQQTRSNSQVDAECQQGFDSFAHQRELITRLQTLEHETNAEHLAAELTSISAAWSQADAERSEAVEDAEYKALRDASQQALERVLIRQRELNDQGEHDQARRDERRAQWLVEAQALLDASGAIDQRSVRQLQQQLEPLLKTKPEAQDDLDREVATLLESLDRRLSKQRRYAERKLAAAPEQLQSLADHLNAGELRKAEPLYQKINAALDQARAAGLSRAEIKKIDKSLKEHHASLRDLQHWRRWSADQGRESLCRDAEGLAASAADELDTLAARLNNLRRDWRRIDQSGTPASETYWQRFKQATDQIATRCEPYFKARAERQSANREARRTLCEQLEHFLEAVDWDSVDWKAMVRAEREMRQAWNALDPLDERSRGGLEGRFRRRLAQVDKALKEERTRNRTHKRDLIERMQALVDRSDLDSAINEAKSLQQQWHTTVSGRQQEENTLWQRFRAASDAVFARRHQERSSRSQEFQDHLAQCEALCGQAEALARRPASQASQLAADWERLAQQWRDSLDRPLSRQAKKSLDQRWHRTEQEIQQRLRALQDQADWREIEHLKSQSDFLNHTAQAILSASPMPERDALAAQWSELGGSALGTDDSDRHSNQPQGLNQSFAQLLKALEEPAVREQIADQCEAGRRQREELCLRLEILAHIESPPEQVARRMALQVERLQEKLGDGDTDSLTQSKPLLEDWCLTAPAAADASLQARFERIEAALRPAPSGVSTAEPSAEPRGRQD